MTQTWRTIVVDPPWQYRLPWGAVARDNSQVGRRLPYTDLPLDALAQLRVGDWADPDGAHLYLWTTNTMMREAFTLVDAWGFVQKTILTWCKPQIGLGAYYRNSTEHVLFAVRGRLRCLRADVPTHLTAPRGPHSQKPDAFYDVVESMSPGPRLDVFARRQRLGWDVAGDQVYSAIPELAAAACDPVESPL